MLLSLTHPHTHSAGRHSIGACLCGIGWVVCVGEPLFFFYFNSISHEWVLCLAGHARPGSFRPARPFQFRLVLLPPLLAIRHPYISVPLASFPLGFACARFIPHSIPFLPIPLFPIHPSILPIIIITALSSIQLQQLSLSHSGFHSLSILIYINPEIREYQEIPNPQSSHASFQIIFSLFLILSSIAFGWSLGPCCHCISS